MWIHRAAAAVYLNAMVLHLWMWIWLFCICMAQDRKERKDVFFGWIHPSQSMFNISLFVFLSWNNDFWGRAGSEHIDISWIRFWERSHDTPGTPSSFWFLQCIHDISGDTYNWFQIWTGKVTKTNLLHSRIRLDRKVRNAHLRKKNGVNSIRSSRRMALTLFFNLFSQQQQMECWWMDCHSALCIQVIWQS